jgi:hypothetical protein
MAKRCTASQLCQGDEAVLESLALYQQARRTPERVKTLRREIDDISREVYQRLDDLDVIIEENWPDLDRVRPMLERIREPMTVMGAGRRHWILQHFPLAVHFLPEGRRVRFVQRYLGPESPWWIKDRVLGKVQIQVKSEVTAARLVGDRVRLIVRSDGREEHEMEADRVIAGTGYDFDLGRLSYLDSALRERILRTERAPALSMRFESSVKGLYFVGPMSAMSFGPLFRFVAGANFTARTLARHLGSPFAVAQDSVNRRMTKAFGTS